MFSDIVEERYVQLLLGEGKGYKWIGILKKQ